MRPRLLDLFCGGGGAALGYHRAGFEVVGIDIRPQHNYPFESIQADAMTYPLEGYAAIHASPPCQAYSIAAKGTGKTYPDLLDATRQRLIDSGALWVIENVPGAPMRADIRLCGCMFGLKVRRERWFETSWHHFELRQPCLHDGTAITVVGHGTPTWTRLRLGRNVLTAECRAAMGIDWMTRAELSQAIPPAYTGYVGQRMIEHLRSNQPHGNNHPSTAHIHGDPLPEARRELQDTGQTSARKGGMQVNHLHRFSAYRVDWDLMGFVCNYKGCEEQLICPHCGAVMFNMGYDETEKHIVWNCWRGRCGRDVTKYIKEHLEGEI